jgi:hypothetical protein
MGNGHYAHSEPIKLLGNRIHMEQSLGTPSSKKALGKRTASDEDFHPPWMGCNFPTWLSFHPNCIFSQDVKFGKWHSIA